jgi:hypothetical protein
VQNCFCAALVQSRFLLASAPYWKHIWNLIGTWGNFKDMKELLPSIWQFLNSVFGTILFTAVGFGLVAFQLRKQQKQAQLKGDGVEQLDGKRIQAAETIPENNRIKELEEANTALETGRKIDADTIGEYRSKIEQLELEKIYHENKSGIIELRYKWLHEMADEQAKDISKHVEVRDYFAIYQRSAESIPRVYLEAV